jgi:predicted ATPase
MRIDEFASSEGVFPHESRLMALLAVVGHKSPGFGLPPPLYGDGGTHVYAFSSASQAVLAALNSLSVGEQTVAAVWLGEFGPDTRLLEAKLRRAIDCAEFGEPGQVVLTLAVAETARELLPEGARIMELGNRATSGGVIERLFVIQGPSPISSGQSGPRDRDAHLRFIGRSRQLAELEERITRDRLVTVSGPAGVGKTTLVRRILDMTDPLTNSWYIDASSLASPALLASELTSTLDVRKRPLQTHLEALLANAGELDGVLGIDTGARELAEVRNVVRQLLTVAPNLAIVVISPRPLRLANESVVQLRGLDYPEAPENWHSLLEYDSLEFFESRAAAVVPQFSITQHNVEAIAMICRRLQGNPAALTLAVNKLRALSPRQILDRLDQPLAFLRGNGEHGPERHHSLHTMIAVTVGPLAENAKALLGRLSVVEGAIGFDDSEAMFPKHACLSAFEELIDAGLLDPSGASIDIKRFTTSASVRAYARQSVTQEEFEAAGESHLAYYEQVALQSAAGLAGKEQAAWTRRMEEQCPDIGSTVRVLVKQGQLERAVTMLTAGITFWHERNFPSEALALAEEALKRKQRFPSRARLENFAAAMALRLGDTKKAESYAKRGLERAISMGNARFQSFLYGTMGNICLARNAFDESVLNHRKAADIARECGDKALLYYSLTNLIASENSRNPQADYAENVREALSLESAQTPVSWRSRLRNNIANAELGNLDIGRMKSFLKEALELLLESGHWMSAAISVRTLAHGLIQEKRYADAATLFGGAKALVEHDEGQLNDYERSLTEEGIRAVIEAIGEENFRVRFDAGRLLDADDVLRVAIGYAAP